MDSLELHSALGLTSHESRSRRKRLFTGTALSGYSMEKPRRIATAPIVVRPQDKKRLSALKESPFEPYWVVVDRLISEHDARILPRGYVQREPEASAQ